MLNKFLAATVFAFLFAVSLNLGGVEAWAQAGAKPAKAAPALARATDPAAPVPGDIVGVWITDDGLGAVEIAPCTDMTRRCGRIVWMKNPMDAKGRLQMDVNNPNDSLKTRPVCGSEIITGLARQRDTSWDIGKIYDPKDGDDHDLAAKLKGPNELEVTGYEGTKWLSETFIWKRASAELARCDKPADKPIDKTMDKPKAGN